MIELYGDYVKLVNTVTRSSKDGQQPPPPPDVYVAIGFQGLYLIFYATFRYLAQKNRYLVLCPEIFNTQKRLGPNLNFSGGPSTSRHFAPPSRRPWVLHPNP